MALFPPADYRFCDTLSRLIYSNPFLPERIALEKELLGKDFTPAPWVYHKIDELDHEHPNLTNLDERVEKISAERDSAWLKVRMPVNRCDPGKSSQTGLPN